MQRASPADARSRSLAAAVAGLVAFAAFAEPAAAGASLRLEAPKLAIERAGAAGYDVDLELPRLIFRPGAGASPQRVEIEAAELSWRDDSGGSTPARATLQAALERGEGTSGWSGNATLELSEGRAAVSFVEVTAPARVASGVFLGQGGSGLRGAELRAAGLTIERVAGTDVEARFDFANGVFDVAVLRYGWFDGSWQASGTVSLADERFDASVKATETPLDRLLPAVLGTTLDADLGAFVADARIRGDWSDTQRWLETLAGEGSFGIVGGTLPSFGLFNSVWTALFERIPGVKALELDPGREAPTRLEKLSYPFTLSDSRLATEALTVETDDYRAGGRGYLALDGSQDLDMTVSFTAQGRRKVFSMADLPGPRFAVPLPPVPVEATGSLGAPRIRSDVSGVSLRTLLALLGQVEGVPRALGGLLTAPVRKGADLIQGGASKLLGAGGDSE